MGLVLDSGGLINFARGNREVAALVEATRRRREQIVTSSGCVARAWRSGDRPALLSRLLRGVDEQPLDHRTSRRVGELCAAAPSDDVVDAHIALLAQDHDLVLASDPADLQRLLHAAHSPQR